MSKTPRYNAYQCQYGCVVGTVDVDKGVTPMMIKCVKKATPERPLNPKFTGPDGECTGTGYSAFYPKVPPPSWMKITHEWYKPDEQEKLKLSKPEFQHVEQGGLLLRPRTEKEPVYHD